MSGNLVDKTKIPSVTPFVSALIHPLLGRITIIALYLTMVVALLAGAVEGVYLSQQEIVTGVEQTALVLVAVGLAAVLAVLALFPGRYLDRLALTDFVGAIFYIFTMMASALFLIHDPARSLHAVLWFYPAFIAVTLTQQSKTAQVACWTVIFLLVGVISAYCIIFDEAWLRSTAIANHWIIILSLCASAALLYSLSLYREDQGAAIARIEALQKSEILLRAEVEAKEKARAEAARANAVVTSFLDNISHELRTPLNAVIGFSEIIRDEMFGAHAVPKYKEYAGDILKSGRHLLDLVSQLIYFSNLIGGKILLAPAVLHAYEIFSEVIETLQMVADKAEIKIVTDVSDRVVMVADHEGMNRILTALLDNAIKFSISGSRVFLQARNLDDGSCEISVRDTGIGVSTEEQEEIFKPFRKGKLSEKSAIPGTGLGLTTAKALIEMHGGRLSFDSREGRGTRVSFTLSSRGQITTLA